MTQTHPQQRPPGPPPINNPLKMVRFVRRFNADPLGLIQSLLDEHGDFLYLQRMDGSTHFLTNPDGIHDVLVKKARFFVKDPDYTDPHHGLARFAGNGLLNSNGDHWKKQRKLVAPAFHTQRIREYADTIVQYGQAQMGRWQDAERIDVSQEMMETTLLIIAKILFNTDARADVERIDHAMHAINDFTGQFHFLPTWLPSPIELRVREAVKQLDSIVYSLIEERRTNDEDHGDLLWMLMNSTDEDGNRMSDQEVRDEAVTLLLAGHETTANTLNWLFYLLAQNPAVEQKLHDEIDQVLGGRAPTLADLQHLPYVEMVIKEAMRLYPAAWGIGRETSEPVEIMGYTLPAGSIVAISFYHLHRDPRWWDAPDEFRPERFAEGNEIDKKTYLPFGNGPRVCIGNSFAMMEAQLLLATFAQGWRFTLEPGQVIEAVPRITLYPKNGLPMRAHARKTVPAPTPA